MILDPSWIDARRETAPIVDAVLDQLEDICGSVFCAESDELAQVADAVNDALCMCAHDVSVDASTVIGLASHALKAIGEPRAGLRLFLFGSGAVKPLAWEVAGGDPLWALDLDYLTRGQSMDCELILYPALNAILLAICDVWDDAGGHGMLGLLHTRRALRASLCDDLKSACDERLSRIAIHRNWSEQPQVLFLDLGNVVPSKQHRHSRRRT
ncbi:MAG: hypothetical protein O3C57_03140 [Verrucomicrobia bacterium]|nr:hypothetical protein [Verrucomicrobiota bacterium]